MVPLPQCVNWTESVEFSSRGKIKRSIEGPLHGRINSKRIFSSFIREQRQVGEIRVRGKLKVVVRRFFPRGEKEILLLVSDYENNPSSVEPSPDVAAVNGRIKPRRVEIILTQCFTFLWIEPSFPSNRHNKERSARMKSEPRLTAARMPRH